MPRATLTTRLGFSLIELLVVVSIVSIVLALSFPMISAMRRDTSVSNGVNTVAVAVASIRRYATKNVAFPSDLLPDNPAIPQTLGGQGGLYSGAAAIFTPAGEIRLTRNDAGAISKDLPASTGTLLERSGPTDGDVQSSTMPRNELNGFRDLEIDYLLLPSDTGVAGINRVSGGTVAVGNPASDPPWLLPPPFAVWFDQNGYMVATGWDLSGNRPNDYQFVYYDGDYDGDISLTAPPGSNRASIANYNPDEYNPNHADFFSTNWDSLEEKYILPFDKMEAVVGVYVYSRDAFEAAVQDGIIPSWANDSIADNTLRWDWMKENGQMLMFSKQTGTLMRNRDE